jgi:hypothetical protein
MDTDASPIPPLDQPLDWYRLESGQQVTVHRGPVMVHRGTVDQAELGLGLVWVQDDATGLRKMFSEDDVTPIQRPGVPGRGRAGPARAVTRQHGPVVRMGS